MSDTCLVWFRRDLRLDDHPALTAALAGGGRIVPVYVHAPEEEAPWAPGAASRWWLHGSLEALDADLRQLGSGLWIARGASLDNLRRIAAATGAGAIHWNRLYEPALRERDTRIKAELRAAGLDVRSHQAALLYEPWEIATGAGQPYRVFTPFWRACLRQPAAADPLPAPGVLPPFAPPVESLRVADLELLPRVRWDSGLAAAWTPGESAALARAADFLDASLAHYGERRDRLDLDGTARLAPHLHFGEISPRRLLSMLIARVGDPTLAPAEPFLRELGWREFAHHLLYHFPHTPEAPLDPRFADFPWRTADADALLAAWQGGRTGIPVVDAGMRELWTTGFMHNRARMIVASLLTKQLRLPWQAGARWFWDTLADADLASNTLGWQWSAGCGADAAPYFRIFNPVLQGGRFDPAGAYVRRWCPELARLPDRHLQQPWTAPTATLTAAGIRLGQDYPRPIMDLQAGRAAALAAWKTLGQTRGQTLGQGA